MLTFRPLTTSDDDLAAANGLLQSAFQADSNWEQSLRRYIGFHGRRHPRDLGAQHIEQFLTSLATRDRVSASTQNQALSAILLLYKDVLGRQLAWLDALERPKRARREKPARRPRLRPSPVHRCCFDRR